MPTTTFTPSSDGKINLIVSKQWAVYLDGTNGSLKLVNGKAGDVLTLKIVQPSGGGSKVTWPSTVVWESGVAPALKSSGSGVDTFRLIFDGTSWRDLAGTGGSRFPQRIKDAALGAVSVVGAAGAVVGLTLSLSAGSGVSTGANTEIGRLPIAIEIRAGSGSMPGVMSGTLLTRIDGSGSVLIGSGGLAVGTIRSDMTDAKFKVTNAGVLTAKGAMSGATMTLNIPAAAGGQAACYKTSGLMGYCSTTPTNGTCTCN